jgi:hypothetical protein
MNEFFAPAHLLVLLFVTACYAAIIVVPFWFIFKKAGFSPFMSLLMVIPLVNLIMLYVLAFSPWRSDRHQPPPY